MTISLGAPQITWFALAAFSIVTSCLTNGKQTTETWWITVLGTIGQFFLLWWGGFFS